MFDNDDIAQGTQHPPLGPAYFAARKAAERFMAAFEAEHFKPLVDKVAKELHEKMWENVSDYLLSDTENNLHNQMWSHADSMVRHVLAGDAWAIKKYALGERYDCEKVRAAVAAHIPRELQDAQIVDLKAEVERLKEELKFYRNR